MPTRPNARRMKGPVRWLLDRQLIASLQEIAFYAGFGGKIDPRIWMAAEEIDLTALGAGRDEIWIDYISDTGDGQRATYSVAALCLDDLRAEGDGAAGDRVVPDRGQTEGTALPRGELLFVGGDTAYHVADFATLAERFQQPFTWAHEDLEAHLERRGQAAESERVAHACARQLADLRARRRPLFGIPGNHDYYDFLDGFNRQFRRPFNPEELGAAPGDGPQLEIPGFARHQQASYVALRLPFGWRLWGIDAQGGRLDRRQRHFFRTQLAAARADPDDLGRKLIVALPEPATVLGRYRREREPLSRLFAAIGLERPFLRGAREEIPEGSCRLDLAGDTHHYARTWGTDRGERQGPGPRRRNYASVVAGLGGAFLHSSSADLGEIAAAARYPEPRRALRATLERLLSPLRIAAGGSLAAAGALAALVVLVATAIAPTTRGWLSPLLASAGAAIPDFEAGDALVATVASALEPGAAATLASRRVLHPDLSIVLPIVGFLALGVFHERALRRRALHSRGGERTIPPRRHALPVVGILAAFGFAAFRLWPRGAPPPVLEPFAASLHVLLACAASLLAVAWNRLYDQALFREARFRVPPPGVHLLSSALLVLAAIALFFGFGRYGGSAVAAVVHDLGLVAVAAGLLVGLPAFAVRVGARRLPRGRRAGFAVLGLAHGAVQLTVAPLLALALPPARAVVVAAVAAGATALVGRTLPRLALRTSTAGERHALGAALAALALGLAAGLVHYAMAFAPSGRAPEPIGSLSGFAALVVGALLSSVWFGWYLAIAICWDGHANEAGGAARIESFKQILRLRLRADGLAAWAIAIDEPAEHLDDLYTVRDGRPPNVRIVDAFEIRT